MSKKPSVLEISAKALGIAADSVVAFNFMSTIFEAVGELASTNPALANKLAKAGAYWAEGMADEMFRHQDDIEAIHEGVSA